MMKHIVKNIDKNIDLQVYKKNTSFWMCNTYKYTYKSREVKKTYYPIDKELFPKTVLNNITQLKIFKENIGLT
jgi:hypothetical protein